MSDIDKAVALMNEEPDEDCWNCKHAEAFGTCGYSQRKCALFNIVVTPSMGKQLGSGCSQFVFRQTCGDCVYYGHHDGILEAIRCVCTPLVEEYGYTGRHLRECRWSECTLKGNVVRRKDIACDQFIVREEPTREENEMTEKKDGFTLEQLKHYIGTTCLVDFEDVGVVQCMLVDCPKNQEEIEESFPVRVYCFSLECTLIVDDLDQILLTGDFVSPPKLSSIQYG